MPTGPGSPGMPGTPGSPSKPGGPETPYTKKNVCHNLTTFTTLRLKNKKERKPLFVHNFNVFLG